MRRDAGSATAPPHRAIALEGVDGGDTRARARVRSSVRPPVATGSSAQPDSYLLREGLDSAAQLYITAWLLKSNGLCWPIPQLESH
eukprot:6213109-Pleurochrysis_carterae.AAC.9